MRVLAFILFIVAVQTACIGESRDARAQSSSIAKPTQIIKDTDGLEPSAIGSFATQPRPVGYVHTIAYPAPHAPRKRRFVPTPRGTGWREIPNTKLISVATPEMGTGGIYAVVSNWTGGDFSEELQLFINPPGGGHLGNDNSTFYGFDVDALEVFEFYPPSPLQTSPGSGAMYGGDRAPVSPSLPQATHVYDGSAWTKNKNGKPVFLFMGYRGKAGDPDDPLAFYPWMFDPEAISVERGTPYRMKGDGDGSVSLGEQWIGVKAQGDPGRGVVFMQTTTRANQLSHYDPIRNRWFDHGNRKSWGEYGGQELQINYASVLRIDPVHDIAVLLGAHDGLATLALKRLNGGEPLGFHRIKRAEEMPLVTADMSFAWDPVAKDWLCYGSKGVFSMDPVTWEMKLLDANGPKPMDTGTFDRWFHSAKRDEFFTQNSADHNWWSYKRPR